MTPKDNEQEHQIEEVGNKLANPPTDVQQLLSLLDNTENFLSGVEQCPPLSMHDALRPSMKALVSRDLLRHSDLDVRVAIASCLSEITRITAPDAPYDDDLMKEIFGLIVGAFKDLDEMSSRSFSKRVSILETVAKVRSCVLMLDLECDDLILEMFHHFLNTIRLKHSYTVFSSMETVMTLVIEESENISAKLLSCLLDQLRVDKKNIIPPAKKLAEKVLANCALKLKPYMVDLFKNICVPLTDYCKIVTAVCHGNISTFLQNEMNSSETQADDGKFPDTTHYDVQPQGSAKHDHNVVSPEKAVTDANKVAVDTGKPVANADKAVTGADISSKPVTSNGTFQIGNGDSVASKPKTDFFEHVSQVRDTGGSSLTGSDNLGLCATKVNIGLNISSLKGRKRKASGKLLVNNHHNQIDDKKETPAVTGRKKGRNKKAELPKTVPTSFKEVETPACSIPGKMNNLEPTVGLDNAEASISLNSPNEHDGTHSRKGRPPRSKQFGKKKAVGKAPRDGSSSASGHSRTLESTQIINGDVPMREPSSKKSDVISESEGILLQRSSSKSHPGSAEDIKTMPTTAICDSETNELDGAHSSSAALHIPNAHQGTQSRKGRPPRKKKFGKRKAVGKTATDGSSSASGHKGLLETSQGNLPGSMPGSKKSEVISESEKMHANFAEDSKTAPATATCDSETKNHRQRGRSGSHREVREVDLAGQNHTVSTKKQKGGLHVEDKDKEITVKEPVSPKKSKKKDSISDQSLVKDSEETNSRLKLDQATQETSGMRKPRRVFNEKLVGSKIRVWWPDDERFYDGVVQSFDRISKMHTILYNDDDIEVLLLKKERWEPAEVETQTDVVQEKNTPDIIAAKPSNKKAKGRRGKAASVETETGSPLKKLAADETKSDSPLKSSPNSTVKNESSDMVPKRKGRPPGKVLSAETHKDSNKGKRRSAKRRKIDNQKNENVDKLEKEKAGGAINIHQSISGDKVNNKTTKSLEEVDNDTSKMRGKSKGRSPKSSKNSSPKLRKESGDADDSGIKSKSKKKSGDVNDSLVKSKEEVSPRIESADIHQKKPGRRSSKGSGRKARGGMKLTITGRDLTENDTPHNDQANKAGVAEARNSSGKKRKRGRGGR
ncbi:hypothetical protein KSP39_PZI018027 [Platanthera zijinensis]|uniref:Uncharacterized protein n=1 Tax=Platanthera zijinensis TaxID=2320716 RepID=A0AAP0FZ90_9ASPA